MSAGYSLRQSNEQSERAAIKYNGIKTHIYLLDQITPANLEKKEKFNYQPPTQRLIKL